MNWKRLLLIGMLVMLSRPVCVAANDAAAVRAYRVAHEHEILAEFVAFLSLPNVASDRANIRRNADALVELMQRRGLKPRLLEASDRDAPPAVYGELRVPGAVRTLVLYAHYD